MSYVLFAGIMGMAYGSALFVWFVERNKENREGRTERRAIELMGLPRE